MCGVIKHWHSVTSSHEPFCNGQTRRLDSSKTSSQPVLWVRVRFQQLHVSDQTCFIVLFCFYPEINIQCLLSDFIESWRLGFAEKCNDGVGARVLLENILELLTLSHQSNRNTYRGFAQFDFGMSLVFCLLLVQFKFLFSSWKERV